MKSNLVQRSGVKKAVRLVGVGVREKSEVELHTTRFIRRLRAASKISLPKRMTRDGLRTRRAQRFRKREIDVFFAERPVFDGGLEFFSQ